MKMLMLSIACLLSAAALCEAGPIFRRGFAPWPVPSPRFARQPAVRPAGPVQSLPQYAPPPPVARHTAHSSPSCVGGVCR